jgi:hypothetical protein
MRAVPRTRRYVSPVTMTICRPLLEYSAWRDAFLLRGVGEHYGPVLRRDRRRQRAGYAGPERRASSLLAGRRGAITTAFVAALVIAALAVGVLSGRHSPASHVASTHVTNAAGVSDSPATTAPIRPHHLHRIFPVGHQPARRARHSVAGGHGHRRAATARHHHATTHTTVDSSRASSTAPAVTPAPTAATTHPIPVTRTPPAVTTTGATTTTTTPATTAPRSGSGSSTSGGSATGSGTGTSSGSSGSGNVSGGVLEQPNYTFVLDLADPAVQRHGVLALAQERDLLLAWAVGSTSNSNTTTLVRDGQLLGNGVGQQDRIGGCALAITRARDAGHDTAGAVAYSDSFFPFPDGPQVLIDAGVTAIFCTSGSVRDDLVRQTVLDAGVALAQLPDRDARGFFGH